MVEMYLHRGGFHWPNESYTTHCRKRYRLTQSKNPNAPPCDPSLWLIHYCRADREYILPANQIPLQPQVQATLGQRRFLQTQGHLARKEFMLHDKANWPTINMPSAQGLQYPPHMIARQQVAAQMQMGASPMRNIADRGQHRRGPSNALEPTLEEEEDVARGDLLDLMTSRDISKMRYEQHHEWMEEIMSSPFAMKQIVPTDLGLGRKGELEALTSGFFDTPTSVLQETSANAANIRVGRMEVGKAEEFTAKAAKKVAEMEAELENLKKRHARRMAKIEKSSALTTAERKLRTAAVDTGRRTLSGEAESAGGPRDKENVDDIVREVETMTGKKIEPVSMVECVQKGGLEEKVISPKPKTTNENAPQENGANVVHQNGSNSEAGGNLPNAAASNMQQQQQQQQPTSNVSQASPALVPSHGHGMQQLVAEDATNAKSTIPSLDDMDVDVEMAGLEADDQQQGVEQTAENDVNEWVMVDDMSASTTGNEPPPQPATADSNTLKESSMQQAPAASASPTAAATTVFGSNFANTPTGSANGGGIQGLTPAAEAPPPHGQDGASETPGLMNTTTTAADFNLGQEEAGGFDTHLDVDDAAGDGLVDFGDHDDEHGGLNLDVDDMGMGMGESAFGDAFHPPEEDGDESQGHGLEGDQGGGIA